LKKAEDKVKELAEEKSRLQEQLTDIEGSIETVTKNNAIQGNEIREEMHNIEILNVDLGKLRRELDELNKENGQLTTENEAISKNLPELRKRIEDLRQKIQLNEILKEVDLEDMKMLKQNNIAVNSAITNLISRWENLENKI
jgi:chromosome segregation ATPase